MRNGKKNWLGAASRLSLMAGIVACADGITDPGGRPPGLPSATGAAAQISAAVQGRVTRGIEDAILRSESRVQTLGGMFVDTSGTVVAYVGDPAHDARARDEAIAIFGALPIPEELRARLTQASGIRIRRGQYAFSQLVDWQMRLLRFVAPIPGFVAIDADESLNRVRIDIESDGAEADVLRAVSSAGVPVAAVAFRVAPRPSLLKSIRDSFRPTGNGVQISNPNGWTGRCTLGWNVTTSYGERGFLTASHCSATTKGSGGLGEAMYQPITMAMVGNVTINPPWTDTLPSQCSGVPLCTEADVMFVQYSATTTSVKQLARTEFVGTNNSGGSISVSYFWANISGSIPTAWVGLSVDKVGRTTGWTRGSVAGTCEWPAISGAVVHCVDRVVGARAGTGDSGSPVFVSPGAGSGATIYPLGVLYAGGPVNYPAPGTGYDSGDQSAFCTANCVFYYNTWTNINYALGRVFNPAP